MSKQAMELALEALRNLYSQRRDATEMKIAAITALEKAIKHGEVVVTKDESGAIVCVTRQDEEGRILSVKIGRAHV